MDWVTYLQNQCVKEIVEQEDARIIDEFSRILWNNGDKCKGNVLRCFSYKDFVNMKKVCFLTHFTWAIESPFRRQLHELHKSV
jgi:hypothetical protein